MFSGVLLYGPPGTGKTLMARACAAQTKVTGSVLSFNIHLKMLKICMYFDRYKMNYNIQTQIYRNSNFSFSEYACATNLKNTFIHQAKNITSHLFYMYFVSNFFAIVILSQSTFLKLAGPQLVQVMLTSVSFIFEPFFGF